MSFGEKMCELAKNVCQNCSQDVYLDWIFCPECGYQNNKEAKLCLSCKQIVFIEWLFCTHCGTRLHDINVVES